MLPKHEFRCRPGAWPPGWRSTIWCLSLPSVGKPCRAGVLAGEARLALGGGQAWRMQAWLPSLPAWGVWIRVHVTFRERVRGGHNFPPPPGKVGHTEVPTLLGSLPGAAFDHRGWMMSGAWFLCARLPHPCDGGHGHTLLREAGEGHGILMARRSPVRGTGCVIGAQRGSPFHRSHPWRPSVYTLGQRE